MNQLSLFDLYSSVEVVSFITPGEISLLSKETLDNKIAEKICSVKRDVKTIYAEKLKNKGLNDIMELKYSIKMEARKNIELITNKIANKILLPRLLNVKTEENFNSLLTELNLNKYYNIQLSSLNDNEKHLTYLVLSSKSIRENEVDKYLPYRITASDENGCVSALSSINNTIKRNCHDTSRGLKKTPGKYYMLTECSIFLAYIMFISTIKDYCLNISNAGGITYFMINHFKDLNFDALPSSLRCNKLAEKFNEEFNIPYSAYEFSNDTTPVSKITTESLYIKYLEGNLDFFNMGNILRNSSEFKKEMLQDNFDFAVSKNVNALSHLNYSFVDFINNIFLLMIDESNILKNEAETEYSNASDYASSYQTKKNIPEKVENAMKKSIFNNYFGYVEFDSLVDLTAMDQIEKEFIKLAKALNISKKEDHSIRFRRLGKHRAGGLYFYNLRTICIDLDSPNSLTHEYFHMVDYSNNKLSEKSEFFALKERYKRIVSSNIRNLPDSEPFKAIWDGNTKYNKSYYFQPTEIFARLGEIYVQYVLKIDNSLVDIDGKTSFVYPKDDINFLNMLQKYFSKII